MGKQTRSAATVSTVIGIALTVGCHVAAALLVSFSSIKYLYPPPPESSFVMDFSEDEQAIPQQSRRGRQPQSENVDKTREVELVQKSESPHVSQKANQTTAVKENGHGDVEVPTPPRKEEPQLDARASFPGMSKKDTSTTAPHSAASESDSFKAGQSDGNTKVGKVDGKANAHVEGRSVQGYIGQPAYNIQESGIVVVRIWVDQTGVVKKAQPGYEGTTVTNSQLWNDARNAAMKTRFNMKADAPVLQEGTITYRFNLK